MTVHQLLSRLVRLRMYPNNTKRLCSIVVGLLGLTMTADVHAVVEPQPVAAAPRGQAERSFESMYPLDRQLEQATDGLGPSAATAAIYAEFEGKWDAELNRVYGLLLAELSPVEQAALREAQRAWLRSRDADRRIIDALYCPPGHSVPTMYVSAHAYAQMNLTRARVLSLIRWRERHAEIVAELSDSAAPAGP